MPQSARTLAGRAAAIYDEGQRALFQRTDRMFTVLMIVQWLAGIAGAIWISPRAWAGMSSYIHPHVWAAVFLGGAITFPPVAAAAWLPGRTFTRHAIAIGQTLMSALLIHLLGGRIETHFHVFGSLAFLAFYRDWRVLISGSLVVALDHLVRGMYWPQSVYGIAVVQPWRWLEHAGWVAFEDIFLIIAIVRGQEEMKGIAENRARLEHVNAEIEEKVRERTAELEQAREAALAGSRAKSEFLSSMSHEIRTPMNAVLGMADLLSESELDSEQRRYLEVMIGNGNALLNLINDILDLAKVESGCLTLERQTFELVELSQAVCETLALRAHQKNLELACHIRPDVPAFVVGDPLRLRQILTNLVGNSIKFTEEGEVVLRIDKDSTDGSEQLHFSVSDTGIGITPEQRDQIFAKFTQADSSTTRKYGGTGLGLPIAKRLVELMDGRIWVESQLGQGSVFHFTAKLGVAAAPLNRQAHAAVNLQGARILVVDDTEVNRLIVRQMVSQKGAEVAEADSGERAVMELDRARRAGRPYQILLVDCRMPGMDGIETARRARAVQEGRRLTILMLTSDDVRTKEEVIRDAGIDACLVKPIRAAQLFAAIGAAMGERAAPAGQTARSHSANVSAPHSDVSGNARILVVDDSIDNRFLVGAYLKTSSYELESAENGKIAVEKFASGRYDLVLMDIQMPVMDGYTAVHEIRKLEKEQGRRRTPIVALTASALEEDSHKSIEAGCDVHVSKPIKKAALLAAIADALEKYGPNARAGLEPQAVGESPLDGVSGN